MNSYWVCGLLLTALFAPATNGWAQRARFPKTFSGASGLVQGSQFQGGTARNSGFLQGGGLSTGSTGSLQQGGVSQGGLQSGGLYQGGLQPSGPLAPVSPAPLGGTGSAASSALGVPRFDPYSSRGAASNPPSLLGSPSGGLFGTRPTAPGYNAPQAPLGFGGGQAATAPQFPTQNPPVQFPNNYFGQPAPGPPGPQAGAADWTAPLRVFQGVNFTYTWLAGGSDPFELDINDFEVAAPIAIPNFLFTGQPVTVSPSFALHLWDGPTNPNPADLPGNAYSAFLAAYWESNPNYRIGAEVGAKVGVYSDFNTLTSDSLRIQGLGLLRMSLSPTVTVRVGGMFLDRAKIKFLPAGGILWEPNSQTKFDIFFPNPKLAQYLTTLGNQDLWWYVGGEYGGGSWTVERDLTGVSERIDINDIRVALGVEFGPAEAIRQGRRIGFFEVGYVFNREVVYVVNWADSFDLDNTVMVRAGFEY